MSAILLGNKPGDLRVEMATGADFSAGLRYKVNGVVTDWPEGTAWTLIFENGVEFEADVDGSLAMFNEADTIVDALPTPCDVRLRYVNGTTKRVPYKGRAYRG